MSRMMALYPQEKNLRAQTQPKHIRNAPAATRSAIIPLADLECLARATANSSSSQSSSVNK